MYGIVLGNISDELYRKCGHDLWYAGFRKTVNPVRDLVVGEVLYRIGGGQLAPTRPYVL